jgi:hypothetical protein
VKKLTRLSSGDLPHLSVEIGVFVCVIRSRRFERTRLEIAKSLIADSLRASGQIVEDDNELLGLIDS